MADADPLSDDEVARVVPVLANRVRATERSVEAFRPPRTGILEQISADWHHFVVGRRGVGKSMLLLTIAAMARSRQQPMAFIDLETLRDNPYPDVLIRLLMEMTAALDDNLGTLKGRGSRRHRRRAQKSLRALREKLEVLLHNPQEATHQVLHGSKRSLRSRLGFTARAKVSWNGLGVSGLGGAERTDASESTHETTSEFVQTKLDGLRSEVPEFRHVLEMAVKATTDQGAIVILDDFYFIRREDQPDVLSYLHSLVKGLNIWLKIGAVEHRLNEFEDGDPPRGLQPNNDAGKIAMDVTLADYAHTKRFLEEILRDVCGQAGVAPERLVTENARIRLVIASGGVPRDYLNLCQAALDKATRRAGEPNRPRNKITAEDVTQAAPDFFKQKEDDLRVDARPQDADRLRHQFNDVLNFCLNGRGVNVFLVEARLLRETGWGRDIAALSDLRFFHRIGNLTVKSSEPTYVGQRYEGFALDLSSYASTRVRGTQEIEFWTTDGFQRLRGASHVYTPEIARRVDAQVAKARKGGKAPEPVKQVEGQLNIYDELGAGDGGLAGEDLD